MRDRSQKTLPLPEILRKKLRVFGRRLLAERCLSPLLAGIALAVLLFLAGILVDRFWEIAPVLRCAFPLVSGLAVLGGAGFAVVGVFRRPRDPEVLAGAIDNRLEDSLDTLRSAVNFIRRQQEGESPGHKVLVAQTAREAERMAEELEPAYVTSFSKTWRGVGLVAILCGLSFLTAQHPGMPMKLLVKRFFDPYGNYPRPSWTQIHLVGDVPSSLEAGNDLELTARVSGGRSDPEVCTLVMLPAGADQAPQRLDMQPLPDGTFQGRVRNVSESFSFFIEARDGRTARRKIEVL
ncbi:MAG: hypothetical protein KGZ25_01255, partial [Planctomycetes bacterium]|nr:hypothetical protein [Planctomycetota bacterium]